MQSKINKVLVVVDVQNDFVSGSLGSAEAQAIVPKVVNKVKEYADRGNKIIFTMDTHGSNYLESVEGKKLPVEHCIKNTHGWEIVNELKPWVNDKNVITKPTFGSVVLANALEQLENKCLLYGETLEIEFVGLCTDVCVVSNVLTVKTHCTYSNIKVDKNCCAGITPEKHDAAIETMKSCQVDIVNYSALEEPSISKVCNG